MKSKIGIGILLSFALLCSAQAYDGTLSLINDYFYNYETFYLPDFDFNEASNNPDIFSYTLRYEAGPSGQPAQIRIEFEMRATIPSIGMENRRLMYVKSTLFPFLGTVKLTSRTVDIHMDKLYYETGQPIDGIYVEEGDLFSEEVFKELSQSIFRDAKLIAGDYYFILKIWDENSPVQGDNRLIRVSNPTELQLVSPGGASLNDPIEIITTYPLFEWDSELFTWSEENCPDCGYRIRVCEYDQDKHQGNLQQALRDDSNLPRAESGLLYYPIPKIPLAAGAAGMTLFSSLSSFQYPSSADALPLQEGKSYVWQIIKRFPTTSGPQEEPSEIFVFKIPAAQDVTEDLTTQMMLDDQYMGILNEILGSDLFAILLADELAGFNPTGNAMLGNGQPLTPTQLETLLGQIISGAFAMKSIKVE